MAWKKGRGKLGPLQPLLGAWRTANSEGSTAGATMACTRSFTPFGKGWIRLEAVWQVMEQRFRSRQVPLKNLVRGKVDQASGGSVRQEIKITQGIDSDTARKITKHIKDAGYKKVQSQIQGDAVRVSAPSRDELQAVIQDLKGEDWGMELNFGNYR